MKIQLQLPVIDVKVNQPFGVNYLDWYKSWNLLGHNGIDFEIKHRCPIRAAHDGYVTFVQHDKKAKGLGVCVYLVDKIKGDGIRTRYGHLDETDLKLRDFVKAGQVIGYGDNTGNSTGHHLHFDLAKLYDGKKLNINNGYNGCIDPSPFFCKNWDKSHAYHRYGREGSWLAEFKVRFKNPWLHRYLIRRNSIHRIYDNEFINALVYGGWDIETVMNDGMREVWAWAKKDEFQKGKINFMN